MATDIKLSKPLTVDGKVLETISLDLDRLTGKDFCFCEQEALVENANMPSIDVRMSPAFQAHIAARASGIAVERLRELGLRDYGVLVSAVRDFFVGAG